MVFSSPRPRLRQRRTDVAAAVLIALAARCADAALHEKPPCGAGEVKANVSHRVLCTKECKNVGESCGDAVPGVLAEPRCVLQLPRQHGRQTYCALACSANSYCPKGTRCTKNMVGETSLKSLGGSGSNDYDDDNPLVNVSPMLLPPDSILGVCTYKAKSGKEKKKVLELTMRPLAIEAMKKRGISLPPGRQEL
eukprot:TRINITY_DN18881_c0_g2_i1.p1 TRINITY_DN18881_c0_g2~~TRINITY_DN18881_c0_g2_i1.p1  ORF type:complete len:212 (+),score=29.09 TRINITY_DN18881_c0_g2_i1:55-636(+)